MTSAAQRGALSRAPAAGGRRPATRSCGATCWAGSTRPTSPRGIGTPFYVYDLDVIERQVEHLRAALPPIVELAYAVKANPALAIVAHLGSPRAGRGRRLGRRAGHRAPGGHSRRQRIVVTGPGKRDAELREAVAAGVRAITVESPRRAGPPGRSAAAPRAGACPSCSARRSAQRTAWSASGWSATTGPASSGWTSRTCGQRRGPSAGRRTWSCSGSTASGRRTCSTPGRLAAHVRRDGASWHGRWPAHAGVELRLVDAGGGLGIPYEPHEESLDVVGLRPAPGDPRRGLGRNAGPAAICGCCWSRAASWWGPPAPMSRGRRPQARRRGARSRSSTAASTTCSGRRWSARSTACASCGAGLAGRRDPGRSRSPGRSAPGSTSSRPTHGCRLRRSGDLVAVLDAGAYGFTESMPLFLSHPIPAEVAIRGGRSALIRPRQEPSEWLGPTAASDAGKPARADPVAAQRAAASARRGRTAFERSPGMIGG